VGARVIVYSRAALDPTNGTDQHVERRNAGERQQDQEEKETVRRSPDGELRDVDAEIVAEEWVADSVGDSLPRERGLAPPPGCAHAHQQPEQGAGGDGDSKQRPGGEGLAKLQVGDVATDLHGAHRAIHQEQVADEPGGGDQNSSEIEREPENVPVGQVGRGLRRKLCGPPTVGQENRGPAAHKQQGKNYGEYGGEAPAPPRHAGL
jgi:hypothetical protein